MGVYDDSEFHRLTISDVSTFRSDGYVKILKTFSKEMASSFFLQLWIQLSVKTFPARMKVIASGLATQALDKKWLGL
jgi:hypothetical protein